MRRKCNDCINEAVYMVGRNDDKVCEKCVLKYVVGEVDKDGVRCARCGKKENLITYYEDGFGTDILCPGCVLPHQGCHKIDSIKGDKND